MDAPKHFVIVYEVFGDELLRPEAPLDGVTFPDQILDAQNIIRIPFSLILVMFRRA